MSKLERYRSSSRRLFGWILALVLLGGGFSAPAVAGAAPAALDKAVPEDVTDLLAIQKQVQKVLPKSLACTVGIRIGHAAGSGVIVSEEGYVLTAGHVAGNRPNTKVTIILPDGKEVEGITLGVDRGIDTGMIKITEKGKWPHAPMGMSSSLKEGQWCLALGHPGGFKSGRPPVVRLGRVLGKNKRIIQTDCALVGGDSGGPLFDLEGNVIGIHSRISESISSNIHVPIDAFRTNWKNLTDGKVVGPRRFVRRADRDTAYFGIVLDSDAKGCVVKEVREGSPADKAGIKAGDKIIKFDSETIDERGTLRDLVEGHKPGDRVKIELVRGPETVTMTVRLGVRD
jgi:serine protease Do